jgi:hypothetical protein
MLRQSWEFAWALCLLLLQFPIVPASPENVQLEIDTGVWMPFLAASNAFDADGFLAVLSKDVVRVSPDARQVDGLARYQSDIREGFQRRDVPGSGTDAASRAEALMWETLT